MLENTQLVLDELLCLLQNMLLFLSRMGISVLH